MAQHSNKNAEQLAQEEIRSLELRIKQLKTGSLNSKETNLLAAWTKRHREEIREELFRDVPKNVYCDLAGRQRKSVDEFGVNYSIPVNGPVINLYAAIQSLHTRVSELASVARPYEDVDDIELEREKLKQEIGKLKRQSEVLDIDIKTRMNELVSRELVIDKLNWLSGQLRALGAQLHRVGGPDAQIALNEFLEKIAEELDGGSLSI